MEMNSYFQFMYINIKMGIVLFHYCILDIFIFIFSKPLS